MTRLLSVAAAVLLAVGCGKVTSKDDDAGAGECLPTQTLCSETCVDTQTSHSHCGTCGNECGADEVCTAGGCAAECANADETACEGSCVDTDTDPQYCGDCDTSCTAEQACIDGGCENLDDLVNLEITSRWPEATGWLDPTGAKISMTFGASGIPGATFECRTGPASMVGSMAFTPCDGGDGTGTTYEPEPVGGSEEGTYRSEMRVKLGSWNSDVVGYDFYAHRSLDQAPPCTSGFTDSEIFTKAASELAVAPTFDPATDLFRPFIHIPFKNVIVTGGMTNGGGWADMTTGDSYDVDVMSLRRRFVLSPDQRLLLIHRVFESRNARLGGSGTPRHDCSNRIKMGSRQKMDCPMFVLNSRGQGVCLEADSAGNLVNGYGRIIDNGYVKLQSRDSYHRGPFSRKFMGLVCPGGCDPWELALPE